MNSLKNQNLYSITLSDIASSEKLSQNSWLVVLHASRKPPHIGMLINGTYHSLTIKGHETNVSLPVLLKTIQQKKIETVFVKLKKHPVFSYDYQNEIFQWQIKQFKKVNPNGGFVRYGFVKNDYIIMKGSIGGAHKRLITLVAPTRPVPKLPKEAPTITHISLVNNQ